MNVGDFSSFRRRVAPWTFPPSSTLLLLHHKNIIARLDIIRFRIRFSSPHIPSALLMYNWIMVGSRRRFINSLFCQATINVYKIYIFFIQYLIAKNSFLIGTIFLSRLWYTRPKFDFYTPTYYTNNIQLWYMSN